MTRAWGWLTRHRLAVAAVAPIVLLIALAAPTVALRAATASHRTTSITSVPRHRVAIVLGAGIYGRDSLSPFLADRVGAAVDLYEAGIVEKLLMTGDNHSDDYDEVTAMANVAVRMGVDRDDIALDHAGFSTYDSCFRARTVFGLADAVIITQQYHLPRAVYTCRRLGVRVDGVGLPDWTRYRSYMPRPQMREVVAAWKAVIDVEIIRPDPYFGGTPIPI